MRMTWAPPASLEPGGRQSGAVGEQERRAHRRAGQHGGGDADPPVARVDERHGPRPGPHRRPGVDRARDARRVGDRIGAAHAGGVLRGEGGEAEVTGGLALAGRVADGRLLVTAVGEVAAAPAATRGGRRGQREDGEQERAASHLAAR
jgi:hypothetical protein